MEQSGIFKTFVGPGSYDTEKYELSRNLNKGSKFTTVAKDYVAPHLRDLMKNPGPADYNTV